MALSNHSSTEKAYILKSNEADVSRQKELRHMTKGGLKCKVRKKKLHEVMFLIFQKYKEKNYYFGTFYHVNHLVIKQGGRDRVSEF